MPSLHQSTGARYLGDTCECLMHQQHCHVVLRGGAVRAVRGCVPVPVRALVIFSTQTRYLCTRWRPLACVGQRALCRTRPSAAGCRLKHSKRERAAPTSHGTSHCTPTMQPLGTAAATVCRLVYRLTSLSPWDLVSRALQTELRLRSRES